ncbi:MAG: type IV pilus assembly protein PilM [Candidatus Paceibacterota bacterium]
MRWSLLKLIPKKFLGIDIGTSSIKIVEISRWGERKKLENYGEVSADILYEKPFRTFEKSTLTLSSQDVSKAIKGVLEEIKTKTKQCIISIPDFSSFFTNFELPPMTKEEFDQAIRYEARQHIPLPLGEVTLDWQILKGEVSDSQKSKLKILLVAVPNEIINQYKEIATLSQLELVALEAEVFGLSRSLIGEDDKGVISIIDIGAQSTTCSIIDKKVLKTSHSFDIGGNELTDRISKALSVDHKIASDFKKKYGISTREGLGLTIQQNIKDILLPLIDIIIREVDKIFINFQQTEGKEVQKIIIAGGTALAPGLKEYFQDYFKKAEVQIANPFSDIFCPPILENTLKEMGPAYSIAVGMALRGLE